MRKKIKIMIFIIAFGVLSSTFFNWSSYGDSLTAQPVLANPSTVNIMVDGVPVSPTGYTISDNNYFKLRDIAEILDIGVDWNDDTNTIIIDTTKKYYNDQPDGKGVLNFATILHLEGWNDEKDELSFRTHAKALREYANLFEKYGAFMTLDAKEILYGSIRWGDNVLGELQSRGHAVGIHADYGGQSGDTQEGLVELLNKYKKDMNTLGINPRHASGVMSRFDWVSAMVDAGLDSVGGVVNYGLWSLDEKLRPSYFIPYKTPLEGHTSYPPSLKDKVTPWIAKDGSNWVNHDPDGKLVIIPTGLSLQQKDGPPFGQDLIDLWDKTLSEAITYTDSTSYNTFCAVWSFGGQPDIKMLEKWLKMLEKFEEAGRLRHSTIPEMTDEYLQSLERAKE